MNPVPLSEVETESGGSSGKEPPQSRPGSPYGTLGEVLPQAQRDRVMSTFRLQVVLTLFVFVLILSLSALMFGLVTRIFDSVTPGIESSLRWKAGRGAAELAKVSELGLVISDSKVILD
ncbi:MAG: hypothetical protein RJA70_4482, partial [Pseudomonadota bacterium]